MSEKHLCRPIYKTKFEVTEELYESPTAKEPLYSRTLRGRYRVDILRAACFGAAALACLSLYALFAEKK